MPACLRACVPACLRACVPPWRAASTGLHRPPPARRRLRDGASSGSVRPAEPCGQSPARTVAARPVAGRAATVREAPVTRRLPPRPSSTPRRRGASCPGSSARPVWRPGPRRA
ncbi:hypothetical protein DDW44_31380 [Streptomyces tirandamycinicus]|uniref:Uncharacterized protein n=1 Tax=Streptomyces tirandamycinicus TaxID=2174846 RepID=A0A2S1T2A9_9ACTN|nr:hypothetical protein DDW44_31380 [Streptomyces tirandamycinicus]